MSTKYIKVILPVHSLIIFNNIYYEIDKVDTIAKKYDIRRIESEIVECRFKRIDLFDCEIVTIKQKIQQDIKKFNTFRESYNKTMNYLNRYKLTSFSTSFSPLGLDKMLELMDLKCGLTDTHLKNIQHHIKKTLDHTLEIHNFFKNPFNFIQEEKQLIKYTIADKITQQLNINVPFEEKCKKWVYSHIIDKYKSFYVEIDLFYRDFKNLCNQNSKQYTEYVKIINQTIIKKSINGKIYVTTQYLYNFEQNLTEKLIDMYLNETTHFDPNIIDLYTTEFEIYMSEQKTKPFNLDSEQKQAVKNMLSNKFSVVTGFPGTGKTSIIQCVLFIIKSIDDKPFITSYSDNYNIDTDDTDSDNNTITNDPIDSAIDIDTDTDDDTNVNDEAIEINTETNTTLFYNEDVCVMSPTGIAYMNIKKKCLYNEVTLFNPKISGTCHKILYNTFPYIQKHNLEKHKHNYKSFAEDNNDNIIYIPKIIIIDEVSMMDIFMFNELIYYCDVFNIHLIIIGDHNQLPSIGPGSVLNSIIETTVEYELFNITKLINIKRQEDGVLLTNIKKMQDHCLTKHDFVDDTMILLNSSEFMDGATLFHEKIYELIELHNLTKDNCKFLSYYNGENEKSKSHPSNVVKLNKILQRKFNSTGKSLERQKYDDVVFKTGDAIIRTENQTSKTGFRANGETAIIKRQTFDKIDIQYADSTDEDTIDSERFYNEFKLAYALTVHKSQGSQYDNIIVFIEPNSYVWDKPALYTAISRANKKCILIADYSEFLKVQQNIKNSKKTTLFLKEIETMYHVA